MMFSFSRTYGGVLKWDPWLFSWNWLILDTLNKTRCPTTGITLKKKKKKKKKEIGSFLTSLHFCTDSSLMSHLITSTYSK
jgi:hypothetical protein